MEGDGSSLKFLEMLLVQIGSGALKIPRNYWVVSETPVKLRETKSSFL